MKCGLANLKKYAVGIFIRFLKLLAGLLFSGTTYCYKILPAG